MKFIHCADLHLGSKIEGLPADKSQERRAEVRAAFRRIVKYARGVGASAIILAGDVFDGDRPLKRDKQFFYETVKNNPDLDFLYLRGNHDVEESYTEDGLANLKTFSDEWRYYDYGGVTVAGIEIGETNSSSLYSSLKLDAGRKNIVVMHGQVGSGKREIDLIKLKNRNIDYLALGHIHSYRQAKLDGRGVYAYSGCPEGRGFDEIGEKGFVELDVGEEITARFVPQSQRVISEYSVDVSDIDGVYSACDKVSREVGSHPSGIARINLCGEIGFDGDGLAREAEKQLAGDFYFLTVKDKTVRKFDLQVLKADSSLKGEFIRTVLAGNYSDGEKSAIIAAGLNALSGRGVE